MFFSSNFIKKILEPLQNDEELMILLPDHTSPEFENIFHVESEIESQTDILPLLKTLQINVEFNESLYNSKQYQSSGPKVAEFVPFPEVITDIETAELFEPGYLEEDQIDDEENLLLTIHTDEFIVATPKNKTNKKGSLSMTIKKKRKEDVKETKNKKILSSLTCQRNKDSEEHPSEYQPQSKQKCNFCGKYFRRLFQLQNHLRMHTGEKPFVCHTCGKAFSQETTLKTHMRIHSGLRPFKCKVCLESFNVSSALVAHEMWKHNSGKRPFLCTFCSKSFPTKSAVRKHETIHKPEKKHSCQTCQRNFARADHLKSHMNTHTKKELL